MDPWTLVLTKHRVKLVESIRFHGTLLWDHLIQNGVITKHQRQSQEGKIELDMSRYVLDLITFRPQFDGFVKALRDSDQAHVADLLLEESVADTVTGMKALSVNDVTVTLVAPWCAKEILKDAEIQYEEFWLVEHTHETSSNAQEIDKMLRLLLYTVRRLSRCMGSPQGEHVKFTMKHVIVGDEVKEETQEEILDILLQEPTHVVYFACSMTRPIKLHKDIADKFSKLLEFSSVFTDVNYDKTNKSMNYLAHECMAVGCKRPFPDDSSPWGGLLDMVVPMKVLATESEGRHHMTPCDSCPAAYAVATAIVILNNSPTLGIPASDMTLLKSTRTMRRVLISLCDSDTPGQHQPLTGFGTLKPESVMKDDKRLRGIIIEQIDYRRDRDRSTHADKKVTFTSSYTETCKESFLRQLTAPRSDLTHKVVVGIIGSGLNPSHPLLAGRHLNLTSKSVCSDEPDNTLDSHDDTTWCTACIVNMLSTASGDSLLDNVHFLHIKDTKSDGTYKPDDYGQGLSQFITKNVHVIVDPLGRQHQSATWSAVEMIHQLKYRAVFLTPAWFTISAPYHSFPETECLALNGIHSDDSGRLSNGHSAGPHVDFLAPVDHHTTTDGCPILESNTRDAAIFTAAVTVYILLLAKKHGIEERRCQRLSTTDTMRQILIQMW